MAGLEDVLRRIANDAAWADQVRLTPTEALRGYDLGPDELVRLERALGVHPAEPTKLFQADPPGAAPQAGMPWRAVAAATAALSAGLAIGLTGLFGRGGAAATLRPDAASYYGCSDDTAWGAPLGDLHRGDQVWIIGRTGASWAVIRHPDNPGAPAWMPRAALADYGDLEGLPELTCSTALAAAAPRPLATPAPASPTSASPTSATATASSAPSAPTPSPTTAPRSTSAGSTRPQPTSPAASPTSTPHPTTSTPKDTTGPALTLTTDSGFLYSEGSSACTAYRQQVTLTVAASDPSGVTVTAATWTAGGKTGAATSLGGGRFRVGPLYSTHSGAILMTLSVTARDGLGNTSNATRTVDFRQIAEACIG